MTSTPAAEEFPGDLGRDAVAAGGVFAVGDDEIERVLFAQFRQEDFDRVASGLADDVADEEKFHAGKFNHERRERHERKGADVTRSFDANARP